MPAITVVVTGPGSGTIHSPTNAIYPNGAIVLTNASVNLGSTFGGWSCVGTGLNYSTGNATGDTFTMPSATVTCTATFNLAAPPPVSAPVDSGLALSLTFLGITAMVGFKKWRNRKAGH